MKKPHLESETRTMTTYHITSTSGVDFGTYTADSAEEAIDLLSADAGYLDAQDAADVLGMSLDWYRSGLRCEELHVYVELAVRR